MCRVFNVFWSLVWGLRNCGFGKMLDAAFWSSLEGFRAEIADFWFGHGPSGYRMHSEHERHCGLSMDVLVIGRIRNTNVIVV